MTKYVPVEDNNHQRASSLEIGQIDNINTTGFQRYFLKKDDFHQIDKDALFSGREINFSIFINKDFDFQPVINASDNMPQKVSPEILDMEGDIAIKASDIPLYNKYLKFLEDVDLPDNNKTILMKEKSKIILRDVLADPRDSENIKRSSAAVEKIADTILNNNDALYDLLSIINYDYYLYTHSVNVAVLSIGLGVSIGLPKKEISNLGLGAILHDIGKSSIPPEILNKSGRLTESEFKIMKFHVLEGAKILRRHKCFPEESFPAVTQHHEKLSGMGYPFGIKASNMKLYGKITAIADCYDSLTARTPYKYPLAPFSALNIIVKETENYDHELLAAFIKMLGRVKKVEEK
ncbi:MAG: HD domain-containing protein [Bacteroidetes bacterium]|nr:HD domain-containing protein [Bacteroidota bacterium]